MKLCFCDIREGRSAGGACQRCWVCPKTPNGPPTDTYGTKFIGGSFIDPGSCPPPVRIRVGLSHSIVTACVHVLVAGIRGNGAENSLNGITYSFPADSGRVELTSGEQDTVLSLVAAIV